MHICFLITRKIEINNENDNYYPHPEQIKINRIITKIN